MTDGPGVEEPRRVGLAFAIRNAFRAYLDEVVLFLLLNVGWVLIVAVFAFARAVVPILVIATPLLALPTAVLTRLAVAAARDASPSWAMARAEIGRLPGRKVLLATIQLVVLGVGIANLVLAVGIGGLPAILAAAVAGYAVIATWLYAMALWPIVCDPVREGPLRFQLRLAAAVVLLRPLQLAVLALLAALAVVVSLQLIVPAIFLPSLVLLSVAGYVVPFADRLRPAPDS